MSKCAPQQKTFNTAIKSFGKNLKDRTTEENHVIQAELENKQKEWGEKGEIEFNFDVNFETTSILIPFVEVTMKEHKWVYDVPQVTMKQRDIIFDVPEVKMVPKKTGQYPETFCEDTWISLPFGGKTKGVPKCTVRWSDIITNVPEVKMVEKRISLHIPEFKVSQKEIKLDLPQFKLKDVILNPGGAEKDAKEVQADAEGFAVEAKGRIENAVARAKEEEKFPVISSAAGYFDCLREDMAEKKASMRIMFQGIIDQSSATLKTLVDAKADGTSEAQQIRDNIKRTQIQMLDALAKIDDAVEELNENEKEQIQKIVG